MYFKNESGLLAVQWLRLHLPVHKVQVQSLVQEQRSHMPHSHKSLKQKSYCNKFKEDFKNSPHQKKILKNKNKSVNHVRKTKSNVH